MTEGDPLVYDMRYRDLPKGAPPAGPIHLCPRHIVVGISEGTRVLERRYELTPELGPDATTHLFDEITRYISCTIGAFISGFKMGKGEHHDPL